MSQNTFKTGDTVFVALRDKVHEYILRDPNVDQHHGTVFSLSRPSGEEIRDAVHTDHMHTTREAAQAEANTFKARCTDAFETHIVYNLENAKLRGHHKADIPHLRRGWENAFGMFKDRALAIVSKRFPAETDKLKLAAAALDLWQDMRELAAWPNCEPFTAKLLNETNK